MDTSLYIPTPDRYLHQVREMSKQKDKHPCDIVDKVNVTSLPQQVAFMDSSKLDEFVKALNQVRGCSSKNALWLRSYAEPACTAYDEVFTA